MMSRLAGSSRNKPDIYQYPGPATASTESVRHYSDVIMDSTASQVTNLAIVYSIVYSGADKKNQSSASLAFVKMFLFDDVIMYTSELSIDPRYHLRWSDLM